LIQPNGAFLQIGIGLAIGIPAAIGAGFLIRHHRPCSALARQSTSSNIKTHSELV
jgi:hypothetical protein